MDISRGDKLATMEVLNQAMENAILQNKTDRAMSAGKAYLRYEQEIQEEEDYDFEIAIEVLQEDEDEDAYLAVMQELEEQSVVDESEEI